MNQIIATKIINLGSVVKLAIATLVLAITAIGCGFGLCLSILIIPPAFADLPIDFPYERHAIHSPDGIGKLYLGREIAKVMGHTEAAWLERPSREWQEKPDQVIAALHLKPDDAIADIGAGTGYFSFRISSQLPQGKVFAVDIQPEMIDILQFLKQESKIDNLETVLGDPKNPHLPDQSIDLALMVDAYHEFANPNEMMQGVVRALKPGGRVVLVEYRRENPFIAIKTLHKMTQRQAKREMAAVGLTWLETDQSLPSQHIMIFQKPESESIELNSIDPDNLLDN